VTRAVLFDVHALLYGPTGPALFKEILAVEGIEVTEAEVADALGRLPAELAEMRRCMRTEAEEDDWVRSVWPLLLQALGVADRTDARLLRLVEMHHEYHAFFSLYPEVLPVLHALKERGLKLGVIGNWEPSLDRLIRAFELDSFIDGVMPSAVAGAAKPDGFFFRRALQELGVPAAEAVHVGPALQADVMGALAAGLGAVWLNRTGIPTGHEVLTISDLRGLLMLVGAPA
jgi:FMN phosphatase YigB (HAD superfamily)